MIVNRHQKTSAFTGIHFFKSSYHLHAVPILDTYLKVPDIPAVCFRLHAAQKTCPAWFLRENTKDIHIISRLPQVSRHGKYIPVIAACDQYAVFLRHIFTCLFLILLIVPDFQSHDPVFYSAESYPP